ncbi:MAG: hypothetical protein NTV72_01755 [Candidatus Taylorbacteria bacterium]|nr:hypothetical protein [Candidatus Taylorbacteria bacterium]
MIKKTVSPKGFLIEIFIFLLLAEASLFLSTPLSTSFPRSVLEKINTVRPLTDECGEISKANNALDFFKGLLEAKDVNFVYGGFMENLKVLEGWNWIKKGNARDAQAFNTDIYVTKQPYCISTSTYVHELTHVYQFKNGKNEGFKYALEYFADFIYQIKDPDRIYNFGGEKGLVQAIKDKKKFTDFNSEQQASIIDTYYDGAVGKMAKDYYGDPYTEEYLTALKYYVEQLGIRL